jgi:hypothetical protein
MHFIDEEEPGRTECLERRGNKAKIKALSAEGRPCGAGKNTTVAATLAVRTVLFLLGVK